MNAMSRCHDRRARRRLVLLLACAVAAVLGCAGPAPAAPGLAPLGDGDGQIGLPVNPQIVDSVVVHRGEVYAAVRQLSRIDPGANGEKFQLRVQRFTQAKDAWQLVGGPLSNSGGRRDDMSLLSARGELYVAWTESVSVRSRRSQLWGS